MKFINKHFTTRRKRSKPYYQKNYSKPNIITTLGFIALFGFIILGLVMVCTTETHIF